MAVTWANLNRDEKDVLMALAALHKEVGPNSAFEVGVVDLVLGRACVAELGFLAMYGLAELTPDRSGYLLTGEGYDALPACAVKDGLREHRMAAEQELRQEQ